MSNREQIVAKAESLKPPPIAIEAHWDGDSTGWMVCLSAVTNDCRSHPLGDLREGGDFRLFTGEVPPWPEAIAAQQLGKELAQRFNAEFYFPSPDHPELDCPDWQDRHKGYPCPRCRILLLQDSSCLWQGTCYYCHLAEEREKREASWTPEQRAGPRCHTCGNPATKELNHRPVCADCFDRYEVYTCDKCNCVVMISKSKGHSALCSDCEAQLTVDSLTAQERDSIRNAMARGAIAGIQEARRILNCSIPDAQDVLHVLGAPNATEDPAP